MQLFEPCSVIIELVVQYFIGLGDPLIHSDYSEYYSIQEKQARDPLYKSSTFWVDIMPRVAKFIFFTRHMFHVVRIHISSLKLHMRLSQVQKALGSALENTLKFWKCQGTSFLSMFIWTETSICRVIARLEQCRKRTCKKGASVAGISVLWEKYTLHGSRTFE